MLVSHLAGYALFRFPGADSVSCRCARWAAVTPDVSPAPSARVLHTCTTVTATPLKPTRRRSRRGGRTTSPRRGVSPVLADPLGEVGVTVRPTSWGATLSGVSVGPTI